MADFDPKSIPILDDIIELDSADTATNDVRHAKTEVDSSDTGITQTEPLQDDNTQDLFDGTTPDAPADIVEPDAINHVTDSDSETEVAESALIDYQAKENEIPDSKPVVDEQQAVVIEQATFTAGSTTLDTIVDDVVKQLIPDLEQQLRFLVRQALEEKLPEEIIEQITNNKKFLP